MQAFFIVPGKAAGTLRGVEHRIVQVLHAADADGCEFGRGDSLLVARQPFRRHQQPRLGAATIGLTIGLYVALTPINA